MNSIPVLYNDAEIIIINKPAGFAVQGGAGISRSVDTVLPEQLGFPVFLVHRLDKETSGLLIVAKTPAAASKWTKCIGSKQIKKEYHALCIGVPKQQSGIITEPVMQHGTEKAACTQYAVLDTYRTTPPLCRLSLILDTGRMHQIRIHLAKSGIPIAGDDKHGDFKLNKEVKKAYGIKRLQLAAVRLSIPLGGKEQIFEVPDNFNLEEIQKAPAAVKDTV